MTLLTRPFRVVEIGSAATAPCGRLLAEAGAEVILVESAETSPDVEMSAEFRLFHHAGKRSICLPLQSPTGWDQVRALAAHADVLLEAQPPGRLATRPGLGYVELAAIQPGLVLTSITPFGQTGPYARYAANDLVVFGMGGIMFISGEPGRPPVAAPDQQAYVTAGTHAAFATLAALWARRQDGRGDWVDVSMFECLVAQENTITNYLEPGVFARRAGSQHRTSLPGRIFRCKDGDIHLFISREPEVWQRFVEWLGNPPELADPSWADINTRWEHADIVNDITEAFVATRTREELFEAGQARHLPVVPVYPPLDFLMDPQIRASSPTLDLGGTRLGSYTSLRPAFAVSTPTQGAPAPGEHTEQILREVRVHRTPSEVDGVSDSLRRYPLSDVRVCAFTHVAAGPYATLQLAYLGAEVVKVETTTRIDYWRYRDRNNDPERSRPFADHNKNIRGVTLDLHTSGGLELARALALQSDIVIDNFSAGVLDKLGLGYAALSAVRPEIIVVHMTGLGSTGPRSRYVTFGPSLMAFSGMTYLWNHAGAEVPVGSQSSYPDFLAGAYAAYAITAALHQRAETGRGALLDLSQAQITATALGPAFVAALNQPKPVGPRGNRNPLAAPWGSYPCSGGDDAWCVIGVESDAQWAAFVEVLGRPGWALDPRLQTARGRVAQRELIDAHLAEWTQTRGPREVMQECQARGVPAGMVATGEDLFNDPQLAARGFLVELEHARLGRQRLPGCPVRFSRGRSDVWRFGPLLGEDNQHVLEHILGLRSEQIRAAQAAGAIR